MVLGGPHNRFLPKDCYCPESGAVESAVGVFLKTNAPGTVAVKDRRDANPVYTLDQALRQWPAGGKRLLQLRWTRNGRPA
ncbi:MAG: hypothetical protein HYT87_00805 [Nitrospirae bacterium]|nr:hypothetical protein [Nitrospirota bacterium]